MSTLSSRIVALATLAAITVAAGSSSAEPSSDAYEELKSGYALKQSGDCRQAMVHFQRSAQLHATPKALLNLSDCEQRLGDWVAARGHAAAGQKLARDSNDDELAGLADAQLAVIDAKVAWLTIRLAGSAPGDCVVSLDDVLVDRSALGVALPLNPGAHWMTARASHRAAKSFSVTLAEGAHALIEVAPGAADTRGTLQWPVVAAFGVGAVGLTVGVATGIAAGSKHGTLVAECDPSRLCPDSARADLDAFRTLRTWSTVGYVVGAVGLVGGAALWFELPGLRPPFSRAHAWVGPSAAGLSGSF